MRARILGTMDETLLPGDVTLEGRKSVVLDDQKRVSVPDLIKEHQQPQGVPPLLLLTARDLFMPACSSLFGYASHQHQVAIVSTFRLCGVDKARLQARLANVIAHERGHLEGLQHCKTNGCVMHPVQTVEDLDARHGEPCGHCPRTRNRLIGALIAAFFFLLLLLAIDASAVMLKVSKQPFSWQHTDGNISLCFKKTPLFAFGANTASSTPARAESLARALNQLFLEIHPPQIKVLPVGTNKALITAGDSTIVEVLPSDASGGSAMQTAQEWADQLVPLIQGKGFKTESCVGCHINGIDRIDYEIQNKGKLRK